MMEMQLLRAIGAAEDSWLADTEEYFANKSRRPANVRKVIGLLAAVITLMLMGATAYAADVFGLRAAQNDSPIYQNDPTVNLSGFQDSAVYQASQEWEAWKLDAYRRGTNLFTPETDTSDIYAKHSAFSEEAKQKLNEITEKYNLNLPDTKAYFSGITGLYDIMGQSGFLPMSGNTGGYPRSGILWDDGSITNLLDAAYINGKDVYIELYRTVKGSFLSYGIRSDPDLMVEWDYIAEDGTELVLDIGPYQSVILADLPSSFLIIIVKSGTGQENTNAPVTDGSLNAKGWPDITKEDLEDLADSFDYSIIDSIK